MRKLILAAALFAVPALADAHSETVQAETHAGLAAQATDVATVHHHMHHALNCLAGPGGSGFDAKEMNPCANAGMGAIPDTADAAKKKTLQSAAGQLMAGIAESDLAKAQLAAGAAAAVLKSAE
jgi:hypothetical protein